MNLEDKVNSLLGESVSELTEALDFHRDTDQGYPGQNFVALATARQASRVIQTCLDNGLIPLSGNVSSMNFRPEPKAVLMQLLHDGNDASVDFGKTYNDYRNMISVSLNFVYNSTGPIDPDEVMYIEDPTRPYSIAGSREMIRSLGLQRI